LLWAVFADAWFGTALAFRVDDESGQTTVEIGRFQPSKGVGETDPVGPRALSLRGFVHDRTNRIVDDGKPGLWFIFVAFENDSLSACVSIGLVVIDAEVSDLAMGQSKLIGFRTARRVLCGRGHGSESPEKTNSSTLAEFRHPNEPALMLSFP